MRDKIEYSLSVLQDHQKKCGNLSMVTEQDTQYIECDKCHARVKKGQDSAIFELKGYNIELL